MDALIPSRSSAAMMLSWNEATDLALQRERLRSAVQGVDAQLVVDEVEVDREDWVAVGLAHGSGGNAAAGEVEGHVPPVVAAAAGGQAILPTTWQNRCSVSLVSRQESSGMGE